jgi:hypothetical protein
MCAVPLRVDAPLFPVFRALFLDVFLFSAVEGMTILLFT